MKSSLLLLLVLSGIVLMTGCASYDYQVVEPASLARLIADQPVSMIYEPLEYHLSRQHDRLSMTIVNPTDDRIILEGRRSYVVDPRGESHPIRGRIIAPHSYAAMLLPPIPASGETVYPDIYPYPVGYWPGYPLWGGFYGPFYYGPVVNYYRIYTAYDWKWDTGQARLRLAYDRNGKAFDHDFVIVRQREK